MELQRTEVIQNSLGKMGPFLEGYTSTAWKAGVGNAVFQ